MKNINKLQAWFTGKIDHIKLEGVKPPTPKDYNRLRQDIYYKEDKRSIPEKIQYYLNLYIENNKICHQRKLK